jgi:hypothetical protein
VVKDNQVFESRLTAQLNLVANRYERWFKPNVQKELAGCFCKVRLLSRIDLLEKLYVNY